MSTLLWNKDGVEIDISVMRFLAGDDIILDRELFVFDIDATRAHACGLGTIGILTTDEVEKITSVLDELRDLWSKDDFTLDNRYEDCHSAIESYLSEQLGPLGSKVHVGRSRNDQVLVALRLYMRSKLQEVESRLVECAQRSLEKAREHQDVPMPGYTHLQRAVPSSLGLWYASFAESFIDTAQLVASTYHWINASPLGTAAGYGVNLPLPRAEVASMLGFDRITINPMAAQASRGKYEHQVVATLWQAMQDIRRLAWDLSLFSTQEFAFVKLPNCTTTGSSIMPNKRNPDLVELLRGSCAVVSGCMNELQQVLSLPSGYHRDLQLTKGPLIRAMKTCVDSLSLVPMLISGSKFDVDRMQDAIDAPMYATDRAVDLAIAGVPFRDAYQQVANNHKESYPQDPLDSIHQRTSPGACGDLMLDDIRELITQTKKREET